MPRKPGPDDEGSEVIPDPRAIALTVLSATCLVLVVLPAIRLVVLISGWIGHREPAIRATSAPRIHDGATTARTSHFRNASRRIAIR